MADLKTRLKQIEYGPTSNGASGSTNWARNPDGAEAVAAIEALERQHDILLHTGRAVGELFEKSVIECQSLRQACANAQNETLKARSALSTKAQRTAALGTLRRLMVLKEAGDEARRMVRLTDPEADFSFVSGPVEEMVVDLIDAALGTDIASYLLYVSVGRGVICVSGREYPITSVDDIAAYLDAEFPIGTSV